jgi:hypothetical protein
MLRCAEIYVHDTIMFQGTVLLYVEYSIGIWHIVYSIDTVEFLGYLGERNAGKEVVTLVHNFVVI